MQVKTSVKAGMRCGNHNETLARAAKSEELEVETAVQVGGILQRGGR
jgi:hypothetical protein